MLLPHSVVLESYYRFCYQQANVYRNFFSQTWLEERSHQETFWWSCNHCIPMALISGVSFVHYYGTWSSGGSSNLTWDIHSWASVPFLHHLPWQVWHFNFTQYEPLIFSMFLETILIENSHCLLGSLRGCIWIEGCKVNRLLYIQFYVLVQLIKEPLIPLLCLFLWLLSIHIG